MVAFCVFAAYPSSQGNAADTATPFPLRDGDRVVLIGDGLIEQEQYFGWIEVMLTTAFPEADATFRNLGWNADTPAGASRFGLSLLQAGREPADEGWKQLQKQLELTRPTVAVLGYGMANALESAALSEAAKRTESIARFREDYQRLIERLRSIDPQCRLVLLSPISPVGKSLLSPQLIASYRDVIEALGTQYGGRFVDLTDVATSSELRKDPVHLNGLGYRAAAAAIGDALEIEQGAWQTSLVTERLRAVILEKNRFWFHRSRPANMAYVFGFRKHEQGQNAVEIPQFDPLIEAEEGKIVALRSLRSLRDDGVGPSELPTESKFAEFTPQPHPEFVVGDGLEITLWAENPMLNKPIHMNFDARGRLWVASSEAYPMIEVGQAMPDKIVVLEDTDGDGRADQSDVFADGLLIPTGVAPSGNGVYVAQSTDLLFLEDTDGDGKADRRERVLSGFGTEDTHHNLHTLLFGPDGRLYMNQSVYTRTDTETPYGVVRLKAGGGFRFDPRHRRMDVFFQGLWNPWGHQFDAMGNSFMTDGAGFAGIAYVFPDAMFNPTPGAREQLDLISPGNYPKFCGGEILVGDSFPESWQGSMITCDFRANRVTRFSIDENGAGFVTNQEADLVRTSESTFRPIDVKQGPDGALYIADWSNPIINHGEVDFRDPRRDRWHGRIWRVTVKDRPLRQPADLTQATFDELVDHLFSGQSYLADHARRQLIERSDETAGKLGAVLAKVNTPADRVAATQLSAAVGSPKLKWLSALLENSDGATRAAACRMLGDWADPSNPAASVPRKTALSRLIPRVTDDYPRTRLEAVCALRKIGGLDAITLSLQALDKPTDRFIEHALFLNVDRNAELLVEDLRRDPAWSEAKRQQQLEFVLTRIEPNKATEYLGEYLAEHAIARDGSGPWIDLIAKAGGPQELARLHRRVIAGDFDADATARALTALADAKRLRRLMPQWDGKPAVGLRPLLSSEDDDVRAAAIELAGAWRLRFLVPQLAEIASDRSTLLEVRTKAIDALRSCGGQPAVAALIDLAGGDVSAQILSATVSALAGLQPEKATGPFYDAIKQIDNEQELVVLWRAMLSAKNGQQLLTASLPADGITEVAARAGVRASSEGGRSAQALIDRLMPMSGLTVTASQWSAERAREMRRLAEVKGDAARGEMVYRRSSLQCATCHAIGGVGGKVGPDMTSLGASAPADYIIESLFDPNAKIKENYHSITVLTEDGQVFSGIESGSTEEEMVLRDATDKVIRIPEAEIMQTKPGKSLMPEGLLDRVSQQDQLDLIRFLTQLGKPGPYDASRQTVARVLEVFPGTHRIEQQGNEDILSGAREEGWKPLQARVSGKIERDTLQALTAQPKNIALVNMYLRTKVEVGSDTTATFTLENLDRANVWVDGQPVGTIGDPLHLSAGKHTLLLQIDARDLPESITLSSEDVTFIAE